MDATQDNNGTSASDTPVKVYPVYWIVLSLLIFICVVFQIPGESQDWQGYDGFFELLRIEGTDTFGISRFEPGFVIIGLFLTELFSSNLAVYGIIAAGAMSLKCWVMNQVSPDKTTFLFIGFFYLVRFAPLHELTQLRVACSATLLLIALLLLQRDRPSGGLAFCAAAVAFHFTALVVIPFLFMRPASRKKVLVVTVAVFVTIQIGFGLFFGYFQNSIALFRMYQEAGFGDSAPNPLSSGLLLDWAMIVAGLVIWDRLSTNMRQVLMLQLVGMAIFYAAIDFAIFAHRISELLSVFWIFYVAEGLQHEPPVNEITHIFIVACIALYAYLNIFSGRLFF